MACERVQNNVITSAKSVNSLEQGLRDLLKFEWYFLNDGHSNIGNRDTAEYYLDYMLELRKATQKELTNIKIKNFKDPKTHLFNWYNEYYKE